MLLIVGDQAASIFGVFRNASGVGDCAFWRGFDLVRFYYFGGAGYFGAVDFSCGVGAAVFANVQLL